MLKPEEKQVQAWVRDSNHNEPMFYQVACLAAEWAQAQQQLKSNTTMTKEQIEMLRSIIKQEIEAAGIDGMDHGSWGWTEKNLEKNWEKFRKSFEAQ